MMCACNQYSQTEIKITEKMDFGLWLKIRLGTRQAQTRRSSKAEQKSRDNIYINFYKLKLMHENNISHT